MEAHVTIIIVSYNSYDVAKSGLAGVLSSGRYPSVVVDNASADGSAEKFRGRFPDATVIGLDKNIGYGRAANIGLEKVKTPYALLLNPDIEVTEAAVESLLAAARGDTANAAIWAPAVSDGAVVENAPPFSVERVCGCAMLFHMERLRRVGMFDERIFLYFEETDLCCRAIKAGYGVRYCPGVRFLHLSGKSCPADPATECLKNWHFAWSQAYFYAKHGLAKGKRSALYRYWLYFGKALLARSPERRQKYWGRSYGTKAFRDGVPSFDGLGNPTSPYR